MRPFSSIRLRPVASFSVLLALAALAALAACGGGAPPPPPATPQKPIAVVPAPPPDVSPVPEPKGLVLVGRIAKADAVLKTLATWTRLPLPGGADVVRSIADDSVADAVDLSQPVDGAIALAGSERDPMAKPHIAISVPVRSFDDAKAKLSANHKLTPGKNGQFLVEGIGRAAVATEARGKGKPVEDDDDDADSCVLSPAANGARLVCGEKEAIDVLSPYLTRTVARQTWTSDVHVEMTLAAVREPLAHFRTMLPVLARSMLGASSPALAKLIDAGVNELVDFVGDTDRMVLDAQLADTGISATFRTDYARAQSFIAKLATSNPQLADAPPAAFWHVPGDADLAGFGKGSDPKLFDHPRELLGNVALEATEGAGMPEPERKAVRELVVDRMLGLLTGPLVFAKGYDAAAVDKAIAARGGVKPGDMLALDEAERVVVEQGLGWYLARVNDPITKVGPVLKDWAGLWNRPSFAKWAKEQSSAKMLAQMRIVPAPAGVTLPKDAVHLEIVMPRADLEELPPQNRGPLAVQPPGQKPAPPPKAKKIPRKPIVLHVIAVPDAGATWIGFGLDAKLLAQKAAISLSSAPDAGTLGKSPAADALRDVKANGALVATLRGFLVYTAIERGSRSPFGTVASLPGKGATPIALTFVSQGPSKDAAGGAAVATLKLPRAAIEDIVKLAMSSR